MRPLSRFRLTRICVKFGMITRIWHGRTPASKSDEYLHLMRTVAKYYDFDKNFLLEMEPASTHYETYDR